MFIKLSNSNQELLDKGTPICSLKFCQNSCMYFFWQQFINSTKWYDCVVFRKDWSAKLPMFDMKLCNIWYPSFDMFMLTSVNVDATSHMSNNKYPGRCYVGALKDYFCRLKQQLTSTSQLHYSAENSEQLRPIKMAATVQVLEIWRFKYGK